MVLDHFAAQTDETTVIGVPPGDAPGGPNKWEFPVVKIRLHISEHQGGSSFWIACADLVFGQAAAECRAFVGQSDVVD